MHRKVVDQAPGLVGRRLSAISPNGRFDSGAAELDGRTLESIDAWGKHLFYFFDGRRVLHVHLGMDGRFRHLLRAGVRAGGRIITVDRRDFKVRDRRQTYVYGQKMCARCGSPVRKWDLHGRDAWACESCRPRARP